MRSLILSRVLGQLVFKKEEAIRTTADFFVQNTKTKYCHVDTITPFLCHLSLPLVRTSPIRCSSTVVELVPLTSPAHGLRERFLLPLHRDDAAGGPLHPQLPLRRRGRRRGA